MANYHHVHKVIAHRPKGPSEYAWMSWLPAPHTSPHGTVNQPSDWITMPSIFHATPTRSLAAAPPGWRQASNVASAFTDLRKIPSHGALQQDACQPTIDPVEMGSNGDSDESTECNGHRPCVESALDLQNKSVQGKDQSMVENRSAVQLVELEPTSEDDSMTLGAPRAEGTIPSDSPVLGCRTPKGISSPEGGGHGESEDSCDSEHIAVELLEHLAREAKKKADAEAAFAASFDFTTQRCSPRAPCSSCLQFCEVPLPEALAASSEGLSALSLEAGHDRPPKLKNMTPEEAAQRKVSRHGPKSKSSKYNGVTFYKRTGLWEAHIWHKSRQIYLGASLTVEEAARAYDKAAIMLLGPNVDMNFERESYKNEMRYLYKLNKEQLVIYLRRDSRGLGAQSSYPEVKHVKNQYHATFDKTELLGIFPTEEEAAKHVYKTALERSCGTLASMIINTHHVRNMQSYVTQLHAALHPEAMLLNNQTKASKKRGAKPSPSTKLASAPKKARRPACPTKAAAAAPRNPPASTSRRPRNKTSAGVSGISPLTPSPAAVPAGPSGVGQTSVKKRPISDKSSAQATGSSIKFKLFNVEINVAEEAST